MVDRVVIVGAEPPLANGLARDLEGMAIAVERMPWSRDVTDRFVVLGPSAAILVHDPPRSHAFEALRSIRSDRAVADLAVVVVGREEGGELDAIVAFELGTDDYVPCTAGPREIALRTRAVLRRGTTQPRNDGQSLQVGPIDVDVARHIVTVEGDRIALTTVEFRLLVELVRHRGRVVPRNELLERVWQMDAEKQTRTVDTHVKRLREKLGGARRCIETVRGVGYRLRVAS